LHRRNLALAGLGLAVTGPARAQPRQYRFDQNFGRLSFTARHFGLLSSTGSFGRFEAQVALDPNDPSQAEVTVSVETGSIDMAWPGGADLLRSAAYFDSEAHPKAGFTGRAVGVARGQDPAERFRIEGALTLRGVTKPMQMEARLLRRGRDAAAGAETAEFTASGLLNRIEFGMTDDRTTISDQVRLDVQVRLLVGPA
jgi:polyisoprenoid-binding protein YceI